MKRLLSLALCLLPSLAHAVCTSSDPYSIAVCADSPSMYLRLAETGTLNGVNAADASGNSNLGVYVDSASHLTGNQTGIAGTPTNTSVSADGNVGGYIVNCGTGSAPACTSTFLRPKTAGTWTLEFWGKWSTAPCSNGGVPEVPMSKMDSGSSSANDEEWRIVAGCSGATNYYSVDFCQNSGACTAFASANTFPAGNAATGSYHYIVGVFSAGSFLDAYLNATIGQHTTSFTGTMGEGSQPAEIFNMKNGVSNLWGYKGTLDEVAIYTTAISSARITAHYNAGNVAPANPAGLGNYSVKRPQLPRFRDDDYFTKMVRYGYNTGEFHPRTLRPLEVGFFAPFTIVPNGHGN